MNRIYFLRHGLADHPDRSAWKTDAERPLTAEGHEIMAAEARGMKALKLPVDLIVTSPYVRARQTADHVATVYRLVDRLQESELLEPGGSFRDFERALKGVGADNVMVVGHAPDLGRWLGELIGAPELPLSKGALAWVKLSEESVRKDSGRLVGLLSAEVLAGLGKR